MKIGFIVAMEEEFKALNEVLNESHLVKNHYKVYENKSLKHHLIGIISGIGKAASASATTVLIENYNCDLIINLGSCGGVNNVTIASFVLANKCAYSDVDVSAFGYKKGQLPNQPLIFESTNNVVNFEQLIDSLKEFYNNIYTGLVATADSFISDIKKVNDIKTQYDNVVAVEMEAAAIAQICNLYKKDFILLKKVSDMADKKASENFKEEINKMAKNTSQLVAKILENI